VRTFIHTGNRQRSGDYFCQNEGYLTHSSPDNVNCCCRKEYQEDSRKGTSRLETQKHRELQLKVFLGIIAFFDCVFLKRQRVQNIISRKRLSICSSIQIPASVMNCAGIFFLEILFYRFSESKRGSVYKNRKRKIPQPFGSGTEEKRDIRLFRQRHAKLISDLIQLHSGFLCLPDKEFDLVGFAFTRFAFFRRKYIFLFNF